MPNTLILSYVYILLDSFNKGGIFVPVLFIFIYLLFFAAKIPLLGHMSIASMRVRPLVRTDQAIRMMEN